MKANELRLNNWVLFTDEHKNSHEKEISFADLAIIGAEGNSDSYSPIPLAAEWLEKFGFDIENLMNCIESFGIAKNKNDFYCLFYVNEDCATTFNKIELQYVHQLQNLFFALTGEELTIKEVAK